MNYNNMSEWHHTVVVPRTPNVIFATHVMHLENVRRNGFFEDLPNKLYKDVLLTALAAAKKRPEWQFFITHAGGKYSTVCNVVCGEELLGVLSVESYYSGKTHTIEYRMLLTTPSIREAAQRKNNIASSDPKRILKTLLAECKPTPLEKRALRKADAAVRTAQQVINELATYSVDSNINPNTLYNFLLERGLWDAYKSVAVAKGAKPEFGERVEKNTAQKAIADTLENAKARGKLVTLVREGDGYYKSVSALHRGLSDAPPVFVHDSDLSDSMRTKIGMVKLAEHLAMIPNVGMRIEHVYVLVED